MTRLYHRLLVRLLPPSLFDAMHVVYEECVQSCRDRTPAPLIHPIEGFAVWLRAAHRAGWNPPIRPVFIDGTPYVDGFDDGSQPSWLLDEPWFSDDLQ